MNVSILVPYVTGVHVCLFVALFLFIVDFCCSVLSQGCHVKLIDSFMPPPQGPHPRFLPVEAPTQWRGPADRVGICIA